MSPPDIDGINGLVGIIELDLDQNSQTGDRSGAVSTFCRDLDPLGTDSLVDLFGYDSLAGQVPLYALDDDGTRHLMQTVPASFDETGVSVRIPLEALDEVEGQINAAAVVGTWLATSDCAPNSSALQTGEKVQDPQGDTAPQHDIGLLDLAVVQDELLIRVEFSDEITPTDAGGPNSVGGFIELDVDQDEDTGDTGGPVRDFCPQDPNLGAEYVVNLFLYDSVSGTAPLEPSNEGPAEEVQVSFEPRALTVTVPLTLLEGDDGTVSVAVVVGTSLTGAPSDCAPDGSGASTGSRLYFAQFGNGGGFTSEIVLTNPLETATVRGSVDLLDDDGQPLSRGCRGSERGAVPAAESSPAEGRLEPPGFLHSSPGFAGPCHRRKWRLESRVGRCQFGPDPGRGRLIHDSGSWYRRRGIQPAIGTAHRTRAQEGRRDQYGSDTIQSSEFSPHSQIDTAGGGRSALSRGSGSS